MIRVVHNGEVVEPKELIDRLEDGDEVTIHWVNSIDVEVEV